MNINIRIFLARKISNLFPPLISQRLRDSIFPIDMAFKYNKEAFIKSITGSYLKCTTTDYHGYRFFIHGFFEWRNIIIANSISKFKEGDIIEIGANVGTETISFCDISGDHALVHAYEPLPSNIEVLNHLLKNHSCLKLYNCALSNKFGEAKFSIPPKTSSGTGKIIHNDINKSSNSISVKINKLDYFKLNFNNVNSIFIDTEGHEPFVLEGAIGTIKKYRPIIVIEVSPNLLAKYSDSNPKQLHEFFDKLEYENYVINTLSISKVASSDLESNKSKNWLCIPKESEKVKKKVKVDLILRSLIPWYLLRKLPYKR